jgi:diphthamide biosynthesis enzyme Dph1/Dph2-like protein
MTLSTEMPFDLPELPNIPIAIQLPDSLLKYSLMLSKVYPKAIIVGDSTFASCCVDTVTCSHVSVELIVKFGTSCLSLIEKPVIFVFEKVIVEESVLESLVEQLNIVKANGTVVVLVACEYEHLVPLLKERVVGVSFSHIYKKQPFTPTEEYSIQGRYFDVPKDTTVTFFYIGDVESSQGTSILVQCSSFTLNNSACSIQVFDPMQGMVDWKWSIMKRFRQVELLKDAASVGIVVGTLSVGMF